MQQLSPSSDVPPATPSPGGAPVGAYLVAFVMLGIQASFAGPALSHLRDRMHTDDGGIAWVFVGAAVGYIAGSMLSGRGVDGGKGHSRWVLCMALSTAAVGLVAVVPNLGLLSIAFAVLGFAGGVSDVSGNTLVMWSRPAGPGPVLNALHLCFALGAMVAPILVNRSLHYWHSLWGVVVPMAVITAVCAVVMMRHEPPRRTRLDTVQRSEASGGRGWLVAMICLFFFAYVGLETGFISWIHTYVEQIHYGGAATATGVTTMFGAGFAIGRLSSIWLARRITPGWMVAGALALCIASSLLFVAFRGPGPMLWVVTFLFAISVAPQYASMMAFAESHLALSGANTSAIIGASGIGSLLVPWLLGQLFDSVGPKAFPPVMVGAALVAAAVGVVTGRSLLRAQRPPVTSMIVPVT